MNGYEPRMVETDGGPWCRDCAQWCCSSMAPLMTPCDVAGCCCQRCERMRRALELDDRPADKLAVIANELEAEARPDVRDLTAERFGQPTRGRA